MYYVYDVYMFGIIEYRFIPTTPTEKKIHMESRVIRSHEPDHGISAIADRSDVFHVDGVFSCKLRLTVVRTRRLEDVQFACLNPKQIALTRNATLLQRTRVN